jgi:type II secretory pathway pseudopilin PulG
MAGFRQKTSHISPLTGQFYPRRTCRAFSLVELLVVITLLSLIVLVLMSVFSSTQRAFRAAVTQTDVLEGSRATMEMIAADLRTITPSGGVSNMIGTTANCPVNFSVLANYNSYLPLAQKLPGSTLQRTNLLNYFFLLSRQNTRWIGIGYVVDNTNSSTLYPLYRYYRDDVNVRSNPLLLFSDFLGIIASGQWTNTSMSHLIDGVVHLTVRAQDPNGRWVNTNSLPIYNNALNTKYFNNAYGEAQLYMFGNTVPAAVELEMGVLEDRALARAESLPNNAPAAPPNDRQTLYLQGQSGVVHLFRQRVSIPNVDRSAYQP